MEQASDQGIATMVAKLGTRIETLLPVCLNAVRRLFGVSVRLSVGRSAGLADSQVQPARAKLVLE